MLFGRWEDFRIGEEGAQTRAELSLGVCTCPIPKCSNHSGSIPHLLFLCAAPGVLATPHLLSQTQRGASEARPLEDGSCRPRWPSSQTINYSYRKGRMPPSPHTHPCISISSYLACLLFVVIEQEVGNVISNCCLMSVGLSVTTERYSSLYGCVQVITSGFWGPYESAFVITRSWEQWPGSFLWC